MKNKLASEFEGKANFAKLNVDENQESAAQYGIRGIPTVMVFKDGQQKDTIVGMNPPALKKALEAAIEG